MTSQQSARSFAACSFSTAVQHVAHTGQPISGNDNWLSGHRLVRSCIRPVHNFFQLSLACIAWQPPFFSTLSLSILSTCNVCCVCVPAADVVATAGWKPAKARKDVAVKLTATSFSSRKLQATVDINAPLPVVWEALTDYENLGTFIPSLVENRCLERRQKGCLLYQVGQAVLPRQLQQAHGQLRCAMRTSVCQLVGQPCCLQCYSAREWAQLAARERTLSNSSARHLQRAVGRIWPIGAASSSCGCSSCCRLARRM